MNPLKKTLIGAGLLGATLTGGALGAALVNGTASAQTDSGSTTTEAPAATDQQAPPQRDPSQAGHQANGITEELLTGDDATKVTEAAQAAVPDGTIERVETDAEGDAFEAHMVKADGTHVTVKINSDYSVKTVETGGPGGPGGGHGPRGGQPPASSSTSSDSTTS